MSESSLPLTRRFMPMANQGSSCFGPWYGDTVLAIFLKLHNILGGTNEEEGSITLVKDCNVSFHVWAPRHAWSLKLTKV